MYIAYNAYNIKLSILNEQILNNIWYKHPVCIFNQFKIIRKDYVKNFYNDFYINVFL